MTQPDSQPSLQEQINKLEAMARAWDRCAANAPTPGYLRRDPSDVYQGYAAACREKANGLRKTVSDPTEERA